MADAWNPSTSQHPPSPSTGALVPTSSSTLNTDTQPLRSTRSSRSQRSLDANDGVLLLQIESRQS
ncbi:hypothetical protein [Sporisorium scitamineum]|uniref:Uncharacterized protein n=1 Tax=Sporisorium scitamineum TaxID=49012 RepID=A0A0F7SBU5_9BASI|nr:hypothetical protein [Sporisorium scitamineum]